MAIAAIERIEKSFIVKAIEVSSFYEERTNARVVELVDTQDLKSCGHCGRAGSTPAPGTEKRR